MTRGCRSASGGMGSWGPGGSWGGRGEAVISGSSTVAPRLRRAVGRATRSSWGPRRIKYAIYRKILHLNCSISHTYITYLIVSLSNSPSFKIVSNIHNVLHWPWGLRKAACCYGSSCHVVWLDVGVCRFSRLQWWSEHYFCPWFCEISLSTDPDSFQWLPVPQSYLRKRLIWIWQTHNYIQYLNYSPITLSWLFFKILGSKFYTQKEKVKKYFFLREGKKGFPLNI